MSLRSPSTCTYGRRDHAQRRRVRIWPAAVRRRPPRGAAFSPSACIATEHVERAVRALLRDQVTDEADEADVGRTPSSARSDAAAAARSTATNGSGSRKFGIAQIGPPKPSLRSSSPRSGVSATAASMRCTTRASAGGAAGRHMCGGNPRMRCHTMSGPAPAPGEHRRLDGAATVRDDDVDRFELELGGATPVRRATTPVSRRRSAA